MSEKREGWEKVGVEMPPELIKRIRRWAAKQPGDLGLAPSVRHLVSEALDHCAGGREGDDGREPTARRAREARR